MKKNTLLYVVVFIALAVTAAVIVLKNTKSTLPQELTDFGYDDTASVSKIVLSDHYKNVTTLDRKSRGFWIVNNKYKVNQDNISMLLGTIKNVQVKSPIPIPAKDNVIKDLATNGIKIDIYSGPNLVKSYYVGSPTPDELGTLMLLKGSSQPFITWIPGFSGYLTPRYIVRVRDWRSAEIYNLSPADIKTITVKYNDNTKESFIFKVKDNDFLLYKKDTTEIPVKVNMMLAKKYLSGFAQVDFEGFVNLRPMQADSVLRKTPFASINLTCSGKNYPPLILYYKQSDMATKDIGKNDIDLDRFYAVMGDNPKDLFEVQTYVVGKLMAFYDDLAHGKATYIAKELQ